jgi:hypothetical protein
MVNVAPFDVPPVVVTVTVAVPGVAMSLAGTTAVSLVALTHFVVSAAAQSIKILSLFLGTHRIVERKIVERKRRCLRTPIMARAPPRRYMVEGSGTKVIVGTGIDAGPPTERERDVSLPYASKIGPVEYISAPKK